MAAKKARGRNGARNVVETPAALGYRMPAEWEPHAATWLAWPHNARDWPGKFGAIPWVFSEMARALIGGERVRILVQGELGQRRAERVLSSAGVDLSQIDFYPAATDRSWTRDFLPLVVTRSEPGARRGKHAADELAAVKWRFNGWARYENHKNDDAAGERLPKRLGLRAFHPEANVDGRRQRVVLEGGAIDVDGLGTLLCTEECLLSGRQARNRALGREGTEKVLGDYLGVKKVLWLGHGIAGDDTAGHIDDFARFVGPGRVVVCEERNERDANYRPLAEARERLEGERDVRGRRLDVIGLPMPAPVMFAGERLPASYANFYIANDSVLVPTFNDPLDRVALGILAELFPKRRVVGIHAMDLVLGLGTLHCSTQQEPLGGRAASGSGADAKPRGAKKKRAKKKRAA